MQSRTTAPGLQYTRCVTYHLVAFLQTRWRRLPSSFATVFQKFVYSRMLVPNGNCRNRAQSGRVVHKEHISIRDDDVMSKLILSYHLHNKSRIDLVPGFSGGPGKHLIQSGMPIDLCRKRIKFGLR